MFASKPHLTADTLLDQMRALRRDVYDEGQQLYCRWQPSIQRRAFLAGAQNLAYYLALRQRDLRDLQAALMPYGLSSLGRSESRVLPALDAVIATLEAITQNASRSPDRAKHPHNGAFFRGERRLEHETNALFGEQVNERRIRIMVTFPTEAADDPAFVRDLVDRGMDVARINCAHDTPDVWDRMIQHVHAAARDSGRTVKILMDLGGPKPRTADVIGRKNIVRVGDTVLISKSKPKKADADDYRVLARCTLPDVLDQLQTGAAVWIDDGKFGAVVDKIGANAAYIVLRITQAPSDGGKIKDEKGLNFPDTELTLSPLTSEDLDALDFIATHTDMIGYSFVQTPDDIALLQHELAKRIPDPREIAIIAKIETQTAIRNLPALIAAAAGVQPFGVMIARGDLAIEVGYERTAEMQEEILWLCEAAHIPVIWATQVLEKFVKEGTPSRGEMTDAAMAVRAECVMLNKGEHVGEAVTILHDVLTRMQEHQSKKTPQLRALRAWSELMLTPVG